MVRTQGRAIRGLSTGCIKAYPSYLGGLLPAALRKRIMLLTMRTWLLTCFVTLVTLQAAVLSARLSSRSLSPEQQVIVREALPDLYEASVAELQVRRGARNAPTRRSSP